MKNLHPNQIIFIQKYDRLLESMELAFQYLVNISSINQSDIANTVYVDLVNAAQQVNLCHPQITSLIDLKHTDQFESVVQQMAKWFEDGQDKQQLLKENIIPSFQDWKQDIDTQIKPYVLQ
ncbi:hypothetical protein [Salirhabdus sp. Marseille-P4669]|uniref:hypothetical protein n=1 Tax=Salirhabdus sp. Marseille-P4669 TaxID=2042310 RepID=UPI000C7A9CA6|nr:hypothetical protein [Salirhabdus sp. Marseille-P4669]